MFAFFCSFILFRANIKINNKTNSLIITTLKRKIYSLDNLEKIVVSTENSINTKKYCHIVFFFKDNSTYFISGFTSFIKNKDVEKTQKLVDAMNRQINH